MIDRRARVFDAQLLVALAETLRVAVGRNGRVEADDPDLVAVPGAAVTDVVVGAVEVPVIEKQSLHLGVLGVAFAALPHGGVVLFGQHLVALNVEDPIGVGGELAIGFVGFDGQYFAALPQRHIPFRAQDAQLVRADTLDQFQRPVVALPHANEHLVHHG